MIGFSSYITSTISLPELIWTIVTGTGVYFNFVLAREAVKDLKALRKARINSIREFAAMSGVLAESLKLVVQFGFFAIGVIAMCIPAQNRHVIPTFQWVLTIAFVLMAFIISGAAFIEKIRRRRLIELIMEYES